MKLGLFAVAAMKASQWSERFSTEQAFWGATVSDEDSRAVGEEAPGVRSPEYVLSQAPSFPLSLGSFMKIRHRSLELLSISIHSILGSAKPPF